ncbi:MAG: retroviral-like aspartic protease [Cytophagales bacterium]|nr:retroviral-like aspartic protease [Cytophagales bacterium]
MLSKNKILKSRAFTYNYNALANELRTEVGIIVVGQPAKKGKIFTAIWDTGATVTCITPKVVKELGLKPISKRKIYGADGELKEPADTFFVDIILPDKVIVRQVNVAELKNLKGCDILIGMDIITIGDFSITNINRKTTFSFRMPSLEEIDYVKQYKKAQG